MLKQRYMIVEYHEHQEAALGIHENGSLVNHLPLHSMLGTYHWSRLDAEHVLLLGVYSVSKQPELDAHQAVSVLPHLASTKHLHKGVRKDAHWQALSKSLGLAAPSTMSDVVDALHTVHGPLYAPLS